MENDFEKHDLENFKLPSRLTVQTLMAPMKAYFTPEYYGMENVDPKVSAVYVTNHSVYGLVDGPLIVSEIFLQKGVYIRVLIDNLHYEIPIWGNLMSSIAGTVRASRENCSYLLENGHSILVFPGGHREIAKRKGEEYKLQWKKRMGFAKMAIKHGVPIIPVAVLGGDDAYSIMMDGDEILESPIGPLLKESGVLQSYLQNGDWLLPLGRGIGPTMIPKPVKLYHKICEPIQTSHLKGREDEDEIAWEIRKSTEMAFYSAFDSLKKIRSEDDIGPIRNFFNSL